MDLNARVDVDCGRKDGLTDGWTDGQTKNQTPISHLDKAGATKSGITRKITKYAHKLINSSSPLFKPACQI